MLTRAEQQAPKYKAAPTTIADTTADTRNADPATDVSDVTLATKTSQTSTTASPAKRVAVQRFMQALEVYQKEHGITPQKSVALSPQISPKLSSANQTAVQKVMRELEAYRKEHGITPKQSAPTPQQAESFPPKSAASKMDIELANVVEAATAAVEGRRPKLIDLPMTKLVAKPTTAELIEISNAAVEGRKHEPKNIEYVASLDKEVDRELYEKYKSILGMNSPSLEKFIEIRYNRLEWNEFKAYSSSIEKGELSVFADFELYRNISKEMNDRLLGFLTSNNIKITGKSAHSIARVIGAVEQRRNGVNISDILDALTSRDSEILPIRSMTNGKSQKFRNKVVEVSINPDTGCIIQVNPIHSKKKVEK